MYILITAFVRVLHLSLTASIAALLLILILKLFHKHIGVRFQHALWIIVILRLIIPVHIESSLSLFNVLSARHENEILSIEKNNVDFTYDFVRNGKVYLNDKSVDKKLPADLSSKKINHDKEPIAKESIVTHVLKIASFIWLSGVFIASVFFLLIIWKFKRETSNLKELTDLNIISVLEKCKKKAGINRYIPIYTCEGFKSPCILGILKPKIFIPKYICDANNYKYLSHILLHELIHYKRKDLLSNFLGVVALLIHWFNPIVWFSISKMKLQREYACDSYVLEIIGEEESTEYGMTLINSSKLISNNKVPQLAIFFETKNQIKRRIKMIKNFKKGSYKMSAAAVICCILASGAILTNGINAKSVKADTTILSDKNNKTEKKDINKFLIDSPLKVYDDIKKAEQILGFKFKVPDFLPENYTVDAGFQVIKISDTDNALKIFFSNPQNRKSGNNFVLQISKENMEEFLKQTTEKQNKEMQSLLASDTNKPKETPKVEITKEAMSLSGITGSNITIKNTISDNYNQISKFFIWQNDGIWYAIEYNESMQGSKNSKPFIDLSIDNAGKVASSIKHMENLKNINYSVKRDVSTEVAAFSIYDKEDLKKATDLLGFNPKFPLTIKNDIKIHGSGLCISGNSDIENKKINYELNTFYNLKKGSLTFNQEKSSETYDNIKKNGYVEIKNDPNKSKQIKVETLKINDKEVFKYQVPYQIDLDKQEESQEYIWKENGFYCSISIFAKVENPDEIAKEFVNSKPIE